MTWIVAKSSAKMERKQPRHHQTQYFIFSELQGGWFSAATGQMPDRTCCSYAKARLEGLLPAIQVTDYCTAACMNSLWSSLKTFAGLWKRKSSKKLFFNANFGRGGQTVYRTSNMMWKNVFSQQGSPKKPCLICFKKFKVF